MVNDPKIRATIKEIVQLQEFIAFSGGVHKREVRWLRIQETRLFQKFDIRYCDELRAMIFDYPLNQIIDITQACSIHSCPRLEYQFLKNFIAASRKWKIQLYGTNGKTYDIDMKVETVIRNLCEIAGEIPE